MAKYETVWKVQIDLDRLDIRDRAKVLIPTGAEIVHVAPQGEARLIEFWMRVDPEAPMESREFRVAGTGHPLVAQEHYVGTSHAGSLVWHLFEVLPAAQDDANEYLALGPRGTRPPIDDTFFDGDNELYETP